MRSPHVRDHCACRSPTSWAISTLAIEDVAPRRASPRPVASTRAARGFPLLHRANTRRGGRSSTCARANELHCCPHRGQPGDLARWAENCPENFRHKLQLVGRAGAARGERSGSRRLYERRSAAPSARASSRTKRWPGSAMAASAWPGLGRSAGEHLDGRVRRLCDWGAAVKARALEAECRRAMGSRLGGRRSRRAMSSALAAPARTRSKSIVCSRRPRRSPPNSCSRACSTSCCGCRSSWPAPSAAALVVTTRAKHPWCGRRARRSAYRWRRRRSPTRSELPQSIAEHVLRTSSLVVLSDAGRTREASAPTRT